MSLLLPATQIWPVVTALMPLLSAILTRTANPEAAIGGYGLALSISMFVSLTLFSEAVYTWIFGRKYLVSVSSV